MRIGEPHAVTMTRTVRGATGFRGDPRAPARPRGEVAEGNRVPSAYRQVVRTFSQARAVRPWAAWNSRNVGNPGGGG